MKFNKTAESVVNSAAALFNKIKALKKSYKVCAFLIVSALAVLVGLGASGVRVAYKVNYGGKVIATVKDKSQFDTAVNIVKTKVSSYGAEVERAVEEPEYAVAVVLDNNISSDTEVAEAIIEHTDKIVEGYEVRIDGQAVACVADSDIELFAQQHKDSFKVSGNESVCEYEKEVEIQKGYYVQNGFDSADYAKELISAVPVKTVATVVTDTEIANKTVNIQTADMMRGESEVVQAGSKGLRRTVETVTYINGEATERVTLSDGVVSEPVERIVKVGTAKSVATQAQKIAARNSGFIFPLPKGTFKISSYYGDGRNHKGVDICAPKGTSIFAVSSGTVIYSGWKSGYGNCVDIDHGNGIVTRYGHASALCCSKGDKVSAGDVIALVGCTGNSTANHLHFEVKVNGSNVDPAPYINID